MLLCVWLCVCDVAAVCGCVCLVCVLVCMCVRACVGNMCVCVLCVCVCAVCVCVCVHGTGNSSTRARHFAVYTQNIHKRQVHFQWLDWKWTCLSIIVSRHRRSASPFTRVIA